MQGIKKSPTRLWLSFDEWNVWYRARGGLFANGQKTFAPKLLEEVYNLEDALLVGGFVNTLLRNSARVRVGCLAQIINVIAPLMTSKDAVLRQSIYFPYAWGLKYAHGQVLDLLVESETYTTRPERPRPGITRGEDVPFLDVVATLDAPRRQAALFMLNRDLDNKRQVTVEWRDKVPYRLLACQTLTGTDLKAANSFENPKQVVPQPLVPPRPGARMTFELPARSYTVVHLALA